MPSDSLPQRFNKVDIILGNNFGLSTSKKIFNNVKENFENLGFCTESNFLYTGGFITQYYGNPSQGINVLQIEINRSTYMEEKYSQKSSNISIISNKLQSIIYSTLIDL